MKLAVIIPLAGLIVSACTHMVQTPTPAPVHVPPTPMLEPTTWFIEHGPYANVFGENDQFVNQITDELFAHGLNVMRAETLAEALKLSGNGQIDLFCYTKGQEDPTIVRALSPALVLGSPKMVNIECTYGYIETPPSWQDVPDIYLP